jgi:hypothetical protein
VASGPAEDAGDQPASPAGESGAPGPAEASSPADGQASGPRADRQRPGRPGPAPPEAAEARAAIDSERVADRLHLRGDRRVRFLALQRDLRRESREVGPRVVRLRRELVAELVAERPDRQRIDQLVNDIARGQAQLDRALARTVIQSRALMGSRQEAMFRRYLGQRLRDWRPAAERPRAAQPSP